MSPRTSQSNQKIRDARRDQILQAALKVFAYQGLKPAKIADIAAQAGISQGLVHHYFNSKEDVFIAVVERAMIGALGALADPSGAELTPWERLTRITERMLQGLIVHPEYMLVIIQSLVSQDAPPQTGKLVADLGRQFGARLSKIIQAGQAAGEVVQGDPQELVTAFLAAIQGLAMTQFTHGIFTLPEPLSTGSSLPSAATLLRLLKA